MSDDVTRNPWDRLDDETPKAYAAFVMYRELGDSRSLRAVSSKRRGDKEGTKRGRVDTHIEKWSVRHRWVDRARAFDEDQDRKAQELFTRRNLRRRRAHAKRAEKAQDQAFDAFERAGNLLKPVNIDEVRRGEVGLEEAACDLETRINLESKSFATYERAVNVERTARGMSKEIVEQRHASNDGGPLTLNVPDPDEYYGEMLDIIQDLRLAPSLSTETEDDPAPE